MDTPMDPLALAIPDAVRVSGMSRAALYRALGAGRIRAVKHGKRTLVLTASLRAFLDSLPAAEMGTGRGAVPPRAA